MFREKAIKNAARLDQQRNCSRKWPIYFKSLQQSVQFSDILDNSFCYLAEAMSRQSPCRSHCCPPPGSWGSSRTCRRCRPIRAKGCGPACARGSPSLSPVHPQYQIAPVEGRKQEEKWWEREKLKTPAKPVTFTSNFLFTSKIINNHIIFIVISQNVNYMFKILGFLHLKAVLKNIM